MLNTTGKQEKNIILKSNKQQIKILTVDNVAEVEWKHDDPNPHRVDRPEEDTVNHENVDQTVGIDAEDRETDCNPKLPKTTKSTSAHHLCRDVLRLHTIIDHE